MSGCAGKILVYDSQEQLKKGIPFRTSEVYVKQGNYLKHSKGSACDPAPFFEIVAVPSGPLYYAAVETAMFAKTAFHIKYGENGAVSEIGLDSEPAAAETIKALAELQKVLSPAPAAAAAAAAAKPGNPPCDAGEVGGYIRLEDHMIAGGR